MADQIVKAEPKHYQAWLRQQESVLIDALLMLNGFYSEKPAAASSVTYLYKVLDKESDSLGTFIIPKSSSVVFSRMEKVLRLIHEERMLTLKTSDLFKSESSYKVGLMKFDARDPKLFLDTTVIPIHFVSRLTEYKGLLLPELRKEFDSIALEPTGKQSSRLEKPIDPREDKNSFRMIYSLIKKHYKYDPKASKNADTSKVMRLMQNDGLDISHATVKRMLDKAYRIADETLDRK
jgi:hypothetical protein